MRGKKMILEFIALVVGILLIANIAAGKINRKIEREVRNEQKAWTEPKK